MKFCHVTGTKQKKYFKGNINRKRIDMPPNRIYQGQAKHDVQNNHRTKGLRCVK